MGIVPGRGEARGCTSTRLPLCCVSARTANGPVQKLAPQATRLPLGKARLRVEHLKQVAARHVLHDHQDLRGGVKHLAKEW